MVETTVLGKCYNMCIIWPILGSFFRKKYCEYIIAYYTHIKILFFSKVQICCKEAVWRVLMWWGCCCAVTNGRSPEQGLPDILLEVRSASTASEESSSFCSCLCFERAAALFFKLPPLFLPGFLPVSSKTWYLTLWRRKIWLMANMYIRKRF